MKFSSEQFKPEEPDFSTYEIPSYLRHILEQGGEMSPQDAKTLLETFENNISMYGVIPSDIRMQLLGIEKGDVSKLSQKSVQKLRGIVERAFEQNQDN